MEYFTNDRSLNAALKEIFVDGVSSYSKGQETLILDSDLSSSFAGKRLFIKSPTSASACDAERDGLEALHEAGLPTPKLLAQSKRVDGDLVDALVLEFISSRYGSDAAWEMAGSQLARLHQYDPYSLTMAPKVGFGWHSDNFIGLHKQPQLVKGRVFTKWPEFFAELRLLPQAREAYDSSRIDESDLKRIEQLCSTLSKRIPENVSPSLVHGDLWAGNLLQSESGFPYFIDPAVSISHAEVDLAMTYLFGSFPEAFYAAYAELQPREPGSFERTVLYNLYHILNHLNLFGTGYYMQLRQSLDKLCV